MILIEKKDEGKMKVKDYMDQIMDGELLDFWMNSMD
jgi:hypothetical protein